MCTRLRQPLSKTVLLVCQEKRAQKADMKHGTIFIDATKTLLSGFPSGTYYSENDKRHTMESKVITNRANDINSLRRFFTVRYETILNFLKRLKTRFIKTLKLLCEVADLQVISNSEKILVKIRIDKKFCK